MTNLSATIHKASDENVWRGYLTPQEAIRLAAIERLREAKAEEVKELMLSYKELSAISRRIRERAKARRRYAEGLRYQKKG